LVAGLFKFGNGIAILKQCSDGRHLVRIEPLYGGEKPYSEWLSGDNYLDWICSLMSRRLLVADACR
jgi:hypothetical protein